MVYSAVWYLAPSSWRTLLSRQPGLSKSRLLTRSLIKIRKVSAFVLPYESATNEHPALSIALNMLIRGLITKSEIEWGLSLLYQEALSKLQEFRNVSSTLMILFLASITPNMWRANFYRMSRHRWPLVCYGVFWDFWNLRFRLLLITSLTNSDFNWRFYWSSMAFIRVWLLGSLCSDWSRDLPIRSMIYRFISMVWALVILDLKYAGFFLTWFSK